MLQKLQVTACQAVRAAAAAAASEAVAARVTGRQTAAGTVGTAGTAAGKAAGTAAAVSRVAVVDSPAVRLSHVCHACSRLAEHHPARANTVCKPDQTCKGQDERTPD